ncbi:MAG: hypothetical protein JO144_16630 [Actinobacteria bacterium]|nr:hypothetical protein [Actinomycetota bacterium]
MTAVVPNVLEHVGVSEIPIWFGRVTPGMDAPVDIDNRDNTDDDFHGCDDCNDIDDDAVADAAEDVAEDVAEILGATERLTDTDGDAGRLWSESLAGRRRPTAADLMYRRRKALAKR